MRPKPDVFSPAELRRRRGVGWVGGVLAILYLGAVVGLDFALPRRYPLIDYYGVAALIGAASLRWRATAALAGVSVGAGLIAGGLDDRSLGSASVLLRIGSVAAAGVAAVLVAVLREQREQRLEGMTEVAEVAEHAIVRAAPISLPDLEVATVYRSASTLASVGGDLYEGASSPYGSRLIIGDAKGKGLPAVQLAAVVLGAFRHAALAEPDLGRLVTDLDRTVAAFATDEDFVTALVLEVDSLEVRLVCCGHPWPLIGPPGYVRPVPLEPGLPLGLGGPRTVQVRSFPTRQILVAYTDGLVEARNQAGEMLRTDTIAAAIQTWEPQEAIKEIEELVTEHVSASMKDDVTILAMKRIE
jgi:serine phosphatase RsbU (regulator of sigma subunit)